MKTNDTTKQIGKIFKDKRLARNIPIDVINKDTRIPKVYIEAIEEGEVSGFIAEVYYTGSIRKYALYLGLNANELIDMYLNSKSILNIKVKETEKKNIKKEKISFFRIMAATSAIIIISLACLYVFITPRPLQKPVIPKQKAIIVEEQTTLPLLPKPVRKKVLELEIKPVTSTWIRVTCDDKIVFESILNKGDTRVWTAKENIILRVGYYPGISAALNGKVLDLSQGANDYVSEIRLNKESLIKREN